MKEIVVCFISKVLLSKSSFVVPGIQETQQNSL